MSDLTIANVTSESLRQRAQALASLENTTSTVREEYERFHALAEEHSQKLKDLEFQRDQLVQQQALELEARRYRLKRWPPLAAWDSGYSHRGRHHYQDGFIEGYVHLEESGRANPHWTMTAEIRQMAGVPGEWLQTRQLWREGTSKQEKVQPIIDRCRAEIEAWARRIHHDLPYGARFGADGEPSPVDVLELLDIAYHAQYSFHFSSIEPYICIKGSERHAPCFWEDQDDSRPPELKRVYIEDHDQIEVKLAELQVSLTPERKRQILEEALTRWLQKQ